MPSIALICHCVETIDSGQLMETTVSVPAALQAAAWCDYLRAHAIRIYGATGPGPALEAAHILLQKIKSGQIINDMTVRDINRPKWSGLSDPETVKAGLECLQAHSWLMVETIRTGGRTSDLIRLHPEIHCQNCQKGT